MDSITQPNGTIVYPNISMNKSGSTFTYNYCADSGVGAGSFNTVCASFNVSSPVSFEVTPNGEVSSIEGTLVQLFLILFFIGLMIWYYNVSSKIDFDRWYRAIISKYQKRNYPKVLLSSIVHTFAKETFITYYLLAAPVIMLLDGIIQTFGVSSLSGVFDSLLLIYVIGLVIVAIIFFGKLFEFVAGIVERINEINWGLGQ